MRGEDQHLSDEELIVAADGELEAGRAALVESHLESCWACRTRGRELESAVADFISAYRHDDAVSIGAPDGPRALLRARMAEIRAAGGRGSRELGWRWPVAAILAASIALVAYFALPAILLQRARAASVTIPNPKLTPGAIVLADTGQVCRAPGANNKAVSGATRRLVFEEYGIRAAEPRAYEVDYLITPALGGADDIRNLWPQSKGATMWSAEVKDALEDHLHELVCSGQTDLATAQREIANNWIEAYKKYFHTDRPLQSGDPAVRQ